MLKKIWLGLGIVFTFYLLIPGPHLPPRNLPESLKSDLPGDTVQIDNVAGYFTDLDRQEVMSFYKQQFSRSSLLNIPLPTVNINHRPEYAKQVWVDTMQSYYLEELVHPFRENLFINGYTWEKDVFTKPSERKQFALEYKGRVWDTKVTLRWFRGSLLPRVGLFWLAWGVFFLISKQWSKELSKFKIDKYKL